MRIGFFTTHFPYREPFSENADSNYFCGGEGEVAYHLSINLMKRGHDIRIFTTSSNSNDVLEEYKNITLHRYGKSAKLFDTYFSLRLLHRPSKYEVDIVHAHFSTPLGALAALAYNRQRRKPFVVTYHLDPVANYGGLVRRTSVLLYKKLVVDAILQQADCIIAFSKEFIEESKILQKYRLKIRTIPNGIDLDESSVDLSKSNCRAKLGLSNGEFIILFVGSLIERKGPEILLKAVSEVRKRIPNVRLVFLGPSLGRLENLTRLTQRIRLDSVVDFKGFVSEYEKKLYFASSDLFVSPSYEESWGLSICEAMAYGLPVIVSDLKVFRPIITDNHSGLFAERGNYKDFADKILCLYENEELREAICVRAKEKAQSFSWNKVVLETEKLYLELLDRGSS